jgi:hypothetical protein
MDAYPLEKPTSSADELLQWLQVSANRASAGAVSVKGGLLGVHRWLPDEINEATMDARLDQEAKPFIDSFRIKS